MRISSACRCRACASSRSTDPGAGPTWRSTPSRARSPRAARSRWRMTASVWRDFTYVDDIVEGIVRLDRPHRDVADPNVERARRPIRPPEQRALPPLQYRQRPAGRAERPHRADRGRARRKANRLATARCRPATCSKRAPTSRTCGATVGFAPSIRRSTRACGRFVEWYRDYHGSLSTRLALLRRALTSACSLPASPRPCRRRPHRRS